VLARQAFYSGGVSFPPSAEPLTDVKRVLGVFAHPDDVDFGAGGTVAQWVADGLEVAYVLVTRGDAGGFDDTPREDMPPIREAEQRAAAHEIGVGTVEFLDGYADGCLTPSIKLRRDITRAIRPHQPDRVLTNSPLRRWERLAGPSHPDHLAVGEATTCAIYPDARNRFAFRELLDVGLEPWTVGEVWYAGGPNPDHVVDVTATYPNKLAAFLRHTSQTSHIDLDAMLRDRMIPTARAGGLAEGRLAEAFTVLHTRSRAAPTPLQEPQAPRASPERLRRGDDRRPSATARTGWTSATCAARWTRGSPRS
jgi:LmbE family N-acetylglucosaminyl deacetylase